MAISWGGVAGQSRVRIGIEIVASSPDGGHGYNLSVNFYAQAEYNINDTVYLSISGSGGTFNTGEFKMSGTGLYHVHTINHGYQGCSYGGGPSYAWGASLGGYYSSPSPSHSVGWTLPTKPASVPTMGNCYTPSNITASSVRIGLHVTADNGSGLNLFGFQWANNSSFSNYGYYEHNGHVMDIHGLAPNTTYWFRGRARNGVGWSAWSPAVTAKTLAAPPSEVWNVMAPDILPDSVRLTWNEPSNLGGAAITGYQAQLSLTSDFATAITADAAGTAREMTIGGLTGATHYYTRMRAKNAAGWGPWSAVGGFDTPSGAFIMRGGEYVPVRIWIKRGGQWRRVRVWKRLDGAWRI